MDRSQGVAPDVQVWIGLDVGKESHYATILDAAGEQVGARAVANTEDDLGAVIDEAKGYGAPALVIDLRASLGVLCLAVAAQRQVPVAYVPGLVMRRAADLYAGEAKTDPRDSFVLADTARTHPRRMTWVGATDELLTELDLLSHYDDDLAADLNRLSNRLHDLLMRVSPTLEHALGARIAHPAVQELLTRYPTPTALRVAGSARVRSLLQRSAPRHAERLGAAIFAALAAQSVTLPAEAAVGRVIQDVASDLARLSKRREQLLKDLERVLCQHPFGPLLLSVPGIGVRTGSVILSEVGDIARFPSAGHLASYAGLAPVTRQSGSSLRSERSSRRGNRRLKRALWLAAFTSIRSTPSRDYYARKRAGGRNHADAISCLARRRCDVLHAMLRKGVYYQPPERHAA